MSQVINTNIASITAQRNLNESSGGLQQSIERLSSGLRINSAADDAAGLAISERFSAQIDGLNQAQRNSQDGISFAQTAEGGLEEVGNIAQRIRELAVQSANDTNSESDREALNEEVQQLVQESDRIAETTAFNNQNVLDGSLEDLVFQVGANEGQTIDVDGVNARGSQLGNSTLEASEAVDINSLSDNDEVEINGETFTFRTSSPDPDAQEFGSLQGFAEVVNNAEFAGEESVTAEQRGTTEFNAGTFTGTATESLSINGTEISSDNDGKDAEDIATEINNLQGQTGVTAEVNDSDEVILTESEGNNIELSGGGAADFDNAEDGSNIQAAVDLSVESTDTDDLNVSAGGGSLNLDGTVESNSLNGVDVSTQEDASKTISTMDAVIDQVNSIRGELGAVQNRFESTIANLGVGAENLEAARSRIVDTDFASETAQLTQNQILQQAGTSVLGQANQIPQNVVSLLQ